jgi:hypothetical protein
VVPVKHIVDIAEKSDERIEHQTINKTLFAVEQMVANCLIKFITLIFCGQHNFHGNEYIACKHAKAVNVM